MWLLDNKPDAIHRLIVPAQRGQVDGDVLQRFDALESPRHVIEYMPVGTTYRQRNEQILKHSDLLVAAAEAPEFDARSRRSGTWMTVRIARTLEIPVNTLILSGV